MTALVVIENPPPRPNIPPYTSACQGSEMAKIQSMLSVRIPCDAARRNRLGSLSARYPAANVPAKDMGAETLSTVAARSESRPRLVMTDTMWKISAVLMSECDELAKSRSQKLGVLVASRSEKLVSRRPGRRAWAPRSPALPWRRRAAARQPPGSGAPAAPAV